MPACAACGQDNPEIARFCLACGAAIEAAVAVGADERKVVTVLFCDLVGFTEASQHADPEDVRARVRPYHARLRHEIEGFGGTVEKFIGDAVMAVFGAPTAHEDDPERAVRAGLRILEAIAELNARDAGLDLRVRVGIETGEAIVAIGARPELGEGMVIGDVVNTASRLQGAAPVNGVAAGPATYEATRSTFEYEALGPVSLKGKDEPVPIFHAKAPRARVGAAREHPLAAMVGRDADLQAVIRSFGRAVEELSLQLVTVVGEPGIGKSRLVEEFGSFIEEHPDLIRWRQGRCLAYGKGITFWALGEIVKAEAGILDSDSPQVAGEQIDAAIPDTHPDAAWLRSRLRPLVGLEAPQATREENFAAWRAFLELLAGNRPSVFVFEDLHWADDALLAFLEQLTEQPPDVPMLLLATARPELYEKAPNLTAASGHTTGLRLSPLSEADTARLISTLLESAVLGAEVQHAILERCAGNPLYAEEFVRLLKDRGILTKRASGWTLDPDAEIPLPTSVQGLVASRLDMVSFERKRLLQNAAVVGEVFWSGAVAEITSREPAETQEALHELARTELIRPVRDSSMAGQSGYAFHHALIRDVCYAQIPRSERSERHRLAATWIERTSADRIEDHAEILAAHYSTALELEQAREGSGVAELQGKTLRYLVLAGDRSLGMDVEAAEHHYARALALAGTDDPETAHILARHGDALGQLGRFAEASEAFERAIEKLREIGDVPRLANAMVRYARVLTHLANPRDVTFSDEALALLEPLGPSPELVTMLGDVAGVRAVWSDNLGSLEYAERAISLARELNLPEPHRALGFRGRVRISLGDPGGFADVRRAFQAAVDQGLGRQAALMYSALRYNTGLTEGYRAELELVREGWKFAERHGIGEMVLNAGASAVEVQVELGLLKEALALATRLDAELEAAGDVWNLSTVRCAQAWALTWQGKAREAAPLAEWNLERSREVGAPSYMVYALPLVAAVELARGDRSRALSLLTELTRIPELSQVEDYPRRMPEVVRTALALDEPELAATLSRIELLYPPHQHADVTSRALLAEHHGHFDQAATLFADAADRFEQFGAAWERAQACLGQGRCLLALGRTAEATEALEAARDVLHSLEATPALAEVHGLLRRAAGAELRRDVGRSGVG